MFTIRIKKRFVYPTATSEIVFEIGEEYNVYQIVTSAKIFGYESSFMAIVYRNNEWCLIKLDCCEPTNTKGYSKLFDYPVE